MSAQKPGIDGLRIDRSSRPTPTRSKWPSVAIVVLLVAGVAAWWFKQQTPSLEVQTVAVAERNTNDGSSRTLLNASGYVTARRAATVSSKVTGKVVEILIEEGMKVEPGQVLARLDATNVEASLNLVEAQLESARKAMDETKPNLEFAQQELKRFSDLAATKVVSDSDFRRTEMEAKSLSARLARQVAQIAVAEREVAQWKQQLDDTIIRAPFGGVVTSKNAQPGEMISPMSVGGFTRTGICTIVDMSSLEIEVDVNESFINRVRPGAPVQGILDAYPEWKIPSKVIAIIPTADRQKATVKVRVGFDQLDPRILPDMGVKVAFQSGDNGEEKSTRRLVTVPKGAVQRSGERDVVWVVRDGRAERRAVTVEQVNGDETIISAGLNNGERVIITAPAGLADGSRVSEKKS